MPQKHCYAYSYATKSRNVIKSVNVSCFLLHCRTFASEEKTTQQVKAEIDRFLKEKSDIESSFPQSIVIGPFYVMVDSLRTQLGKKCKVGFISSCVCRATWRGWRVSLVRLPVCVCVCVCRSWPMLCWTLWCRTWRRRQMTFVNSLTRSQRDCLKDQMQLKYVHIIIHITCHICSIWICNLGGPSGEFPYLFHIPTYIHVHAYVHR